MCIIHHNISLRQKLLRCPVMSVECCGWFLLDSLGGLHHSATEQDKMNRGTKTTSWAVMRQTPSNRGEQHDWAFEHITVSCCEYDRDRHFGSHSDLLSSSCGFPDNVVGVEASSHFFFWCLIWRYVMVEWISKDNIEYLLC